MCACVNATASGTNFETIISNATPPNAGQYQMFKLTKLYVQWQHTSGASRLLTGMTKNSPLHLSSGFTRQVQFIIYWGVAQVVEYCDSSTSISLHIKSLIARFKLIMMNEGSLDWYTLLYPYLVCARSLF